MSPRFDLRILPHATHRAAENMAIDLSLLSSVAKEGSWGLRTYGWDRPAFTFGYSQKWEEVSAQIARQSSGTNVERVRRPTGGGVVDHRTDFTYALVIPAGAEEHRSAASGVYKRIHEAVAAALNEQGISALLQPCPRESCDLASEDTASGTTSPARLQTLCFAAPEVFDVIDPHGSKLAGAAMKRDRDGLLVQGSVETRTFDASFNADAFARGLAQALSAAFNLSECEGSLPAHEVWASLSERFSSREWTERR